MLPFAHRAFLFAFVVFWITSAAFAAPGSVTGLVTDSSGSPVAGASVSLVELDRSTKTDAQGTFRFDTVPSGAYLVEVISARSGNAIGRVVVEENNESTVPLKLDITIHHEEVIVTAGASTQSVADVAQSVAVLDDRELTAKATATIGETLAQEPGINQTYYAPGASRPVIRGLGGDRIRVLQDGLGAGDASNVSADHAVSVNTLTAERVEVVRGAATLLYGSNAIGGVVNVLDERIPDHRSDERFAGNVILRYGSNNDMAAGAANLGGSLGWFGWHVDGTTSQSNDYRAGGDFGVKPNSDFDNDAWSVGASWLGESSFVGAAYNDFKSNYGSAFEESVRIDLEQKRWDVRGGINTPFGPFRSLRAKLGGTDYEHVELEGSEVGTRFLNKSIEGRVDLAHGSTGPWTGSFGAQAWSRDFEAIGAEAFVQPTSTDAQALFAFEEIGSGSVTGQFGGRYEHQNVDSSDATLRDRSFNAPSASAGVLWKAGEAYAVAGTLSYSSRVPTAEELFSNGPHIATFTFILGDDDLALEKGLGVDVSLRKVTGRISGELSLFYTSFDDYIFERDTGTTFTTDEGDVLPIVQYSQSAAEFWGAEGHVDFGLIHADPHHLDLELRADYVHAELTDLNEPVPFQPPLRGVLALKYQGKALWGSIEGYYAAEQGRFGVFDTSTPSYTWLNASVGYRLAPGRFVHDIIVRGVNLTDKLSFNSLSRFRSEVPLPGRDVTASYRLQF
jgi:iron complex outermembrane receptor protein